MKAIIFSAGLGTRLKPITNDRPKAMVQLNGKPLIWHAINNLTEAGVSEIVVNLHHFGQQLIDYISNENFRVPILFSDERDELLDTGGGLLKAKKLLQNTSTIIAYNVDVICSLNFKEVLQQHEQNKSLATLIVRNRSTSRYLLFDRSMQLTGWKNIVSGEEKIARNTYNESKALAFSGIQILSPEIFDHITESGKFSIIQLYLRLAKTLPIHGYLDRSDFWIDLGKPGQLPIAERYLNRKIKQKD